VEEGKTLEASGKKAVEKNILAKKKTRRKPSGALEEPKSKGKPHGNEGEEGLKGENHPPPAYKYEYAPKSEVTLPKKKHVKEITLNPTVV